MVLVEVDLNEFNNIRNELDYYLVELCKIREQKLTIENKFHSFNQQQQQQQQQQNDNTTFPLKQVSNELYNQLRCLSERLEINELCMMKISRFHERIVFASALSTINGQDKSDNNKKQQQEKLACNSNSTSDYCKREVGAPIRRQSARTSMKLKSHSRSRSSRSSSEESNNYDNKKWQASVEARLNTYAHLNMFPNENQMEIIANECKLRKSYVKSWFKVKHKRAIASLRVIDEHVYTQLLALFWKYPHPDTETVKAIAEKYNLKDDYIRKWFGQKRNYLKDLTKACGGKSKIFETEPFVNYNIELKISKSDVKKLNNKKIEVVDDNDDDDSGFNFNKYQKNYLEKCFKVNTYPSETEVYGISEKLCLGINAIYDWFEYKRNKQTSVPPEKRVARASTSGLRNQSIKIDREEYADEQNSIHSDPDDSIQIIFEYD